MPWAIVMLEFTDVVGSGDSVRFRRQMTADGRGTMNHLDYWSAMSYGAMDLEDSQVFGPWRMRYSLAHDARDPLRNGSQPRVAWTLEARRLLQENGVDLNRFHGVVAIVNAHADGSSSGLDYAGAWDGRWGDAGWRYCHRCGGLARTAAGAGGGRCPVTRGAHDDSRSGEYALATDAGFPGQAGWRACTRCLGLVFAPDPAAPAGVCPAGGAHAVNAARELRVRDRDVPWGSQEGWRWCHRCNTMVFMGDEARVVPGCAAGGDHDLTRSGAYGIHSPLHSFSLYFTAHETGHGYGLGHAGKRGDPNEYADAWDVMGGALFIQGPYEIAGPGLSAPHRLMLSWIPRERVATLEVRPGLSQRVTLGPLDTLDGARPVAVQVATGSTLYTVELRRKVGFDGGLPRDASVLIHELPSTFLSGQRDWRFCGRCRTMAYAGRLKCAGGGIHDVTRSGTYVVKRDTDAGAVGQHGWRWCRNCQALVFPPDGGPAWPCPYGPTHDHTGSGRYVVAAEGEAPGQAGWRYCCRCGTLSFDRGGGRSACAAGGVHDYGLSGRYVVAHADAAAQPGWRWCAKCQQLVFMGTGIGSGRCAGAPDATQGHDFSPSRDYAMVPDREPYEGQAGWNWCHKCNGIVFVAANGRCAAGGAHDVSRGGGYRMPHDGTRSGGQAGWRFCFKCAGLFIPDGAAGPCAAGGAHDASRSGNYLAPDGGVVKLVPFDATRDDWRPGDAFQDADRNVAIAVESVSPTEATVTVRALR